MMNRSYDVLKALAGRTLSTAESCTGGAIGAALTAIPGSSEIFKGGIICYTNEVKIQQLHVDAKLLDRVGAVSTEVAEAMASGVRKLLNTDMSVSVTGLAGPGGDSFGNPIGTVYIGYADSVRCFARLYNFSGDRETVRRDAVNAALDLLLEMCLR